jgi:hypothetical protein
MKIYKQAKKFASNKLVQGSALMGSAAAAHADMATDIGAAFTAAESNVGLAAGGVVALVAVVTGIGLIVSLLRK